MFVVVAGAAHVAAADAVALSDFVSCARFAFLLLWLVFLMLPQF